jgi:WD40 repeat protein
MGVVYEAEQISLGRRVALKVFPFHAVGDPKSLERFHREAKAAARLHHTNIVPVYEVGREGDVSFYAMQLIRGSALEQVIDELTRLRQPRSGGRRMVEPGRVTASVQGDWLLTGGMRSPAAAASAIVESEEAEPVESAASSSAVLPGGTVVSSVEASRRRLPFFRSVAQVGRQAAQGLAHAHSRGIVHRDIKPSNLLLDTDGVVWIADFGLAKAEDDGLTATGDILGTLRYMAPERFRGQGDARADVYALGMTLYELLTLRPAFKSRDRLTLIERIKQEEPARPRSIERRIPRDLETIVLKAIEKEPRQRYATADEMAEDLRRFLDDEPIQARRASAAERYARWARHHPTIAVLGAVLTAVLVLTTLASLLVADRMARLARGEKSSRAAAEAETYHAVLSEVKALRAGREEALRGLARLGGMATGRRDLPALRTEAAATLGTPDIRLAARVELLPEDLGSFAFAPDGRTLLTAGIKTGLEFWDVPRKSHRSSVAGLTVGESGFNTAVYLPGGDGLAVGTGDHGVVFADPHGIRTTRAPITVGSSRPTRLARSADGRRLAVAWADGAGITVHDLHSGVLLVRFEDAPPARRPDGRPFALSPDGRWLAREEDSDIMLRPIASREPWIVLGRHGRVYGLAYSPDGSMLATASDDHTTVLWDVERRGQFGTLRGHRERVFDVAFSPDGEWIATGSLDYTTRIWETRSGQNVATLPGPGPTLRVCWSPAGDYLATSTHNARDVFLYGVTGRHGVQRWLTGHRVELRCAAADPHRERIATSGYTEVCYWDLSASRPAPVVMEPNPGAVTSIAYSPDGSLLATASWLETTPGHPDVVIVVRDAMTGKIRCRMSRPQIVWALAFDPTGERLAFGDMAGDVVVWDLATSRPVGQFATGSEVRSIAWLDRPHSLVTHGKNTVLLFGLESGELVRQVDPGGGGIQRLVLDRARNRLTVGFQSGALGGVSLPDLTTGPRLEGAHEGSVDCLAVSPDGRLLATGGADHRVVLRDASSFESLLSLPLWAGNVRDLTFDSAGRRLAVVGTDCDVDLWDLAALHDGLTEIGLAWDRPAPAVVPPSGAAPAGEPLRPAVPVLRRPGATGSPAIDRAH